MSKRFWNIFASMRGTSVDFQVFLLVLVLFKKDILKKYLKENEREFQDFVFEEVQKLPNKEKRLLTHAINYFKTDLGKFNNKQIYFIQESLEQSDFSIESTFDKVLFMINDRKGKARGAHINPEELSELMLKIASPKSNETIFNPFAGVSSLSVYASEQTKYYGQEKHERTFIIGALRLIAYEKYNSSNFELADSFKNWPDKKFNYILSTPPFKLHLSNDHYPDIDTRIIEKFYIEKSIEALEDNGKAVIVLHQGFMFNRSKKYVAFRKKLIENDSIESIISFPGGIFHHANIHFSVMILSKRERERGYIKMISADDLVIKKDFDRTSRINVKEILKLYHSGESSTSCRSVKKNELKENNFSLDVNVYLSPLHFPERNKRSESEKLLKIGDLVNVIRPKRKNVTQDYPFVNMTELSGEASNYELELKSLPKKKKYSNDQPLLKEDSLLVGTVGGVLKPTLFQYNETPIFLGSNVYPLRVDTSKIDPEYLILELNSEFVKKQVRKYTKGSTVPHINRSNLLSIVVRVPERQEQARLFNEWITGIARNKIESLNIAKEKLFSEEYDLIHDMHHTLKNELSIIKGAFRDIKGYLLQKSKSKDNVDLTEPIREIKEEADPDLYDTVEQKLNAMEGSLIQMSSFVKNYKTILKFDPKNQNPEWIRVNDFLQKLCIEYTGFEYNINEEKSSDKIVSGIESFQLKVDKVLLRMIITNIIENAKTHGFDKYNDKNLIEFTIRDSFDTPNYYDIEDKSGNVIDQVDMSDDWIEIVVQNTGESDGDDIDFQKIFERGIGKGGEKSSGIGLNHVQKAMESLKGRVEVVRPENPVFAFEIRLKFPIGIGKSPNWEIVRTII